MALSEYNTQKDPARMPLVLLQEGEYKLGLKLTLSGGTETRQQVWVQGYPAEYCLVNGSTKLWTTDGDGNPKKRSCFTIDISMN